MILSNLYLLSQLNHFGLNPVVAYSQDSGYTNWIGSFGTEAKFLERSSNCHKSSPVIQVLFLKYRKIIPKVIKIVHI